MSKRKDCIKDFVNAWKKYDLNDGSSENIIHQWGNRFKDAGYYPVEVNRFYTAWYEIHLWCREKFGEQHYAWAGSTFWFEAEEDAIMFTLRWS
jgi:hypothetical protein